MIAPGAGVKASKNKLGYRRWAPAREKGTTRVNNINWYGSAEYFTLYKGF